MKHLLTFGILLLMGLCIISCDKDDGIERSTLTTKDSLAVVILTVKNIDEDEEEHMHIGFYDNEEGWDKDIDSRLTENEYLLVREEVTGSTMNFTFEDVEPGDYAFSIFQDQDSDGEIAVVSSAIPVPQEPYGFSNNYKITITSLSPPKFSDCSFKVSYWDSISVNIDLN